MWIYELFAFPGNQLEIVQTLIVKGLFPGTFISNSFICKKQKAFYFIWTATCSVSMSSPKWTELTFSSFHLSVWSHINI